MNYDNLYNDFLYIFVFLHIWLLVEFIYSVYKKDKIHNPKETLSVLFINLGRSIADKIGVPIFLFICSLFSISLLPQKPVSLISILACLLISDLYYYFYHKWHHTIPLLWMSHHVHHSGRDFNLATTIRMPWLASLYNTIGRGLPLLLLGFSPATIFIVFSIENAYNFVTHSAYISYPKWLSSILVSPDMHKNHHDQVETNQLTNLARVFTFYDKIFGTYAEPIKQSDFKPGIKNYNQLNFLRVEFDPIIAYIKKNI